MHSVIVNEIVKGPLSKLQIKKVIELAAHYEPKIKGNIEVNLIDDALMRKLNLKYRGKNKTTDVLSFAWQEDKTFKTNWLGQLYISIPQIKRQAKDFKVGVGEELKRMLVHGLLHLAGYDHLTKIKGDEMFKLQEKIIKL